MKVLKYLSLFEPLQSIIKSYSNDAMLRQMSEGIRINKAPEGSSINSKNEWNYFSIPRAIVARDGALSTK